MNNKQTTNKTNKFKKLECAPGSELNTYSCYNSDALLKLRDNWNSRHPDAKITANDPKNIWESLKAYMEDVCDNEYCWLRQKFMENNVGNDLLSYTFAPKTPRSWLKNKNEWLSSVDIEKVMKQYERAYKNFNFIGPSAIDFDTHLLNDECVWQELCEFDLKKQLAKGKKKIGIIFNTDPHYKGGSHWISLFLNIQQDNNFSLYENDRSHQRTNTECGMYSLYVIIELLTENHKIDHFMNTWIKDKTVEKLRDKYFNKEM